MNDLNQSVRWKFPFLAVGQMQKEVTHNEALAMIDMLLSPRAEAMNVDTPPLAPAIGQMWLIGAAPSGAWTGKAQYLACWTQGGWRFAEPLAGTLATMVDGRVARFDGVSWALPPTVALPQGGMVVDSEARAAINALVAALESRGWLSSI